MSGYESRLSALRSELNNISADFNERMNARLLELNASKKRNLEFGERLREANKAMAVLNDELKTLKQDATKICSTETKKHSCIPDGWEINKISARDFTIVRPDGSGVCVRANESVGEGVVVAELADALLKKDEALS